MQFFFSFLPNRTKIPSLTIKFSGGEGIWSKSTKTPSPLSNLGETQGGKSWAPKYRPCHVGPTGLEGLADHDSMQRACPARHGCYSVRALPRLGPLSCHVPFSPFYIPRSCWDDPNKQYHMAKS